MILENLRKSAAICGKIFRFLKIKRARNLGFRALFLSPQKFQVTLEPKTYANAAGDFTVDAWRKIQGRPDFGEDIDRGIVENVGNADRHAYADVIAFSVVAETDQAAHAKINRQLPGRRGNLEQVEFVPQNVAMEIQR